MLTKKKIKDTMTQLFTGDITITKTDLWLIGAVCLCSGIIYGLMKSPCLHGITIGSNNGNNSGNYDQKPIEEEEEEK